MAGKIIIIVLVALFGIAFVAADICKHDGEYCLSHENCCSYSCQSNQCEDVPNPKEDSDLLDEIFDLESQINELVNMKSTLLQMAADSENEYSNQCRRTGARCETNDQCCSKRCFAVVNRCALRSEFELQI